MKILFIATEGGGSKFYRFDAPITAETAARSDIEFELRFDVNVEATKDPFTGFVEVLEVQEDVDLIVIQRPLAQEMNALILRAKEQGIATAVEIDDDFENIHPKNRAAKTTTWSADKTKNRLWLKKSCDDADFVIASTQALLDIYAPHGRGRVLPNFVPEAILNIDMPSSGSNTVGWTGTLQTHPTDLQATSGAVGDVLKRTRATFYTVGDGNGIGTALKLDFLTKTDASGWLDFNDYYPEIKSKIGIGIVPLDDIPFNHAKSRLKGLEFAGLGIPFVASATPDYMQLAELGVGEIAETPADWRKSLEKLITDGRRRTSLGQRYRDIVRQSLTYEANAGLWADAWQHAIDIRREA